MCKRAQCEQCQKVTYTGCGKHLEQVFRELTTGTPGASPVEKAGSKAAA